MFSSGQNLNFAVPADVLEALINSPPAELAFGARRNGASDSMTRRTSGTEYTDIEMGDVVSGDLSSSDHALDDGSRADFYYFTGAAGQAVRVRMVSDAIDSYVILMGTQGDSVFRIGENDDGASGLDADLRAVLPIDGLYAVVASTYEADEVGSYTISVTDDHSAQTAPASAARDTALTIALLEISDVIQDDEPGDRLFRDYLRRTLQDLGVVVVDELPEGARSSCSMEVMAQTMSLGDGAYDVAIAPLLVFHIDGQVTRSRLAGIIMYHGYENLNAAARDTAENIITSLKPLCDFVR
jgi:hypothetical protein